MQEEEEEAALVRAARACFACRCWFLVLATTVHLIPLMLPPLLQETARTAAGLCSSPPSLRSGCATAA